MADETFLPERNGAFRTRLAPAVALALAFFLSTVVAARSWVGVHLHRDRTIQVTGSAKKRIVSDLIQWEATIATEAADRTAAYRALHEHVQRAHAYLKAQGISDDELRISSASTEQLFETEYIGKKEDRIEKKVDKGFRTTQSLSVSSKDVAKVERVSREVTQLIEQGVPVTSGAPSYYYTQLGEMKIQMLAEAARDARTRSEKILGSAGGATLGKLRHADMGIININPANSTETSSEGNNDTTSLEKDILTIVHCTFELDGG